MGGVAFEQMLGSVWGMGRGIQIPSRPRPVICSLVTLSMIWFQGGAAATWALGLLAISVQTVHEEHRWRFLHLETTPPK